MILLAIDTSIVRIGYAVFNVGEPIDRLILDSGTRRIPKMNEPQKVKRIYSEIKDLIIEHGCQEAVIERPEQFSYQRSTTPWGKSKNLESLRLNNIAVGIIATTCVSEGMNIELVTPEQWKGRQSKEVTRLWVNDKYGLNLQRVNYDQSDAIKIGDWWIERQRFEQLKEGSAV